jgi:hypothetical protein
MKKVLLFTFGLLLCTFGEGWGQSPTIDGSFDGVGVWGSAVATNATIGWNNNEANALYVTYDNDYIYFGAQVSSVGNWQSWGFLVNTKTGGGTSEVFGHPIQYNHANAPDYVLRGGFTSSSYGNELVEWNGASWEYTGLGGGNFARTESFVEVRVLKSNLGQPSTIDVQFFLTGDNSSEHGSFNSVPDDNRVNNWNVSGNPTLLSNYSSGISVSDPVTEIESTQAGDWNSAATWAGGEIPSVDEDVVIKHNVTLNVTGNAKSIEIEAGNTLTVSGSNTLNIATGGEFINNGTFTAGSGTVNFNGSGTVGGSSATTFNNLITGGNLAIPNNTTVNGTLTIGGGNITTNPVIFGSNANLVYNRAGSISNIANSWPANNGPTNVTINGGVEIQMNGNRSLSGNLTITNGKLRASGARTLTMNGANQTITWTAGDGIRGTGEGFGNDLGLVINSGSTTTVTGNASADQTNERKFFDITVQEGATLILQQGLLCQFGTFTNNGLVQINANGFIEKAPEGSRDITYGATGDLTYNNGGAFNASNGEWPTSNPPRNVTIQNTGTNVNTSGARVVNGNLTIQNNATLTQSNNEQNIEGDLIINGTYTQAVGVENPVIVKGNVVLNSTGTLSLSDEPGGDIQLEGNWTRASGSTFTPNERAVFFIGDNNQTISSTVAGGENWDYIRFEKPENTSVTLNTNITCNSTALESFAIINTDGSDPFTLNLNGNTLTFTGDGGTFVSNGNTIISGGTMAVNGNKALNDASTAALRFAGNATLRIETGREFDLSNRTLEIDGTLITDGTGVLVAGVNSNLVITGTGNLTDPINVKEIAGEKALGSLTIERVGTHTIGDFDVKGDLTIGEGVIINNTTPIRLNRDADNQDITGGGSLALLTINHTGDGVELSSGNLTITDNLTITNGNVTTGTTRKIILGPTATISEAAGGYVVGVVETERSIAQNTPNDFGGIGVTITVPKVGGLGATTVTRVTGVTLTGEGGVAIPRYYQVNPADSELNKDLNATVVYSYRDAELPDAIEEATDVRVFKRPIGGDATEWLLLPNYTINGNEITVNELPSFSEIVGASENFSNEILPVELISFTGSIQNGLVNLTWVTASELNNYGFEVERSYNARNFEPIGFVLGNGTTSMQHTYRFADADKKGNEAYYRLRQVDFDGSYEYSPVIIVRNHDNKAAFNIADRNNHWNLEIALPEAELLNLFLYDVTGKPIFSRQINHGGGTEYHQVPKPANNGIYLIEIQSRYGREVKKVAF